MTNYSEKYSAIFNTRERRRIAKQILSVLLIKLGNTKNLKCLDYGCSGGEITNFLATYFNQITGIDTDTAAIGRAKKKYKRKNLHFYVSESEKTCFKDNSFDVIVCNQVYEFVEDQRALANELYRILKPGGVVFLGARNKYAILEGQTHLLFIHWLPQSLTSLLAQWFGKDYYQAKYLSLGQIKKLFYKFQVQDLTEEILKNPRSFRFTSLDKYKKIAQVIPPFGWSIIKPLIPNYIFLCRK